MDETIRKQLDEIAESLGAKMTIYDTYDMTRICGKKITIEWKTEEKIDD
tara:strand:- start:568 stop:714 length:147 start_codon:yes stop_codon:yes gene_type:complete